LKSISHHLDYFSLVLFSDYWLLICQPNLLPHQIHLEVVATKNRTLISWWVKVSSEYLCPVTICQVWLYLYVYVSALTLGPSGHTSTDIADIF